ncbi:MAG: Uma2 family endonuclease [Limnothrix sp. RL_2_0]|nr:Uma2 family endonuclease [Limnothrix sp. RL_2_0]
MLLELDRIQVLPGQHIILENVSWHKFERILEDWGEHRSSRLAYNCGFLEIMTPSTQHGADTEIIGDLIKLLLEEFDLEFRSLGSTTFKKETLRGLEPDQCFYIQNEAKIRGKNRIDLATDPPPDLAIEIDITSRTHPKIYAALNVPELWRFKNGKLQINVLQDGAYQIVQESLIFPGLALSEVIPQYLAESKVAGRNATFKKFRRWVQEN